MQQAGPAGLASLQCSCEHGGDWGFAWLQELGSQLPGLLQQVASPDLAALARWAAFQGTRPLRSLAPASSAFEAAPEAQLLTLEVRSQPAAELRHQEPPCTQPC